MDKYPKFGLLFDAKATQYCDGLRGAMVIYDPNDPYKNQWAALCFYVLFPFLRGIF